MRLSPLVQWRQPCRAGFERWISTVAGNSSPHTVTTCRRACRNSDHVIRECGGHRTAATYTFRCDESGTVVKIYPYLEVIGNAGKWRAYERRFIGRDGICAASRKCYGHGGVIITIIVWRGRAPGGGVIYGGAAHTRYHKCFNAATPYAALKINWGTLRTCIRGRQEYSTKKKKKNR